MSSALYEFMPYGAPDIIDGAPRRLFRATTSSVALGLLAFLVALGVWLLSPRAAGPERTVVLSYRTLAAPPPLTRDVAPPEIVVARPVASPSIGVPVPVPDAAVPPEQTIATQQEISASIGAVESGDGQSVVVVQSPTEELPKLGDFVYVDELPALVTDTSPSYPAIAREAEVEGEVLLRVLVGKDGRVMDVHVDRSVPMLDQAAIEAARTWVFKPALSNNRPVAVWIARRVRFSLATPT